MLKYHGHTFRDSTYCACHKLGDARRAALIDPTNTGKLRAKFRSAMRHRWNQMRELVKQMLVKQDLLALASGGLTQVHSPAITGAGSKMDVFQRWLDLALSNAVLQKDGSFMRGFLSEGYAAGVRHAQGLAKTDRTHPLAGHREQALITLARIELEGVMEAVSQQSMRAVSQGLLTGARPMAVTRSVLNIIEKVGVNRANAMIELLVVRAHAEASLDIYEAAGLKVIGLIPESRAQAKVVTDATRQQKAKAAKAIEDARPIGPGSRSSRKSVPSARTIGRIRKAELRLAKSLGENVNVQTAGDSDVCPVCEGIADNGPYNINLARSLIPAHPHCRCIFVPADDDEGDDASIAAANIRAEIEADKPGHIPREGSRKRTVYEVYMKEGRDAAIKKAEELGIKRTSAQSWTNTWKRGSPPDPFGPPKFPTPKPTPPPTVIEPPKATFPKPERKQTKYTEWAKQKREIKVVGKHPNEHIQKKVDEAIASLPDTHRDLLARRGVNVTMQKEVQAGGHGSVLGVYKHRVWGDWGQIEIAEEYGIGGRKFKSADVPGTTVHEIGHAIDHALDWRGGTTIKRQVDIDAAAGMDWSERNYAKYYFSNEKERFAELYRVAYGQAGFGMTAAKAQRVFANSIRILKEMVEREIK
jgi:hypothetical protein